MPTWQREGRGTMPDRCALGTKGIRPCCTWRLVLLDFWQ